MTWRIIDLSRDGLYLHAERQTLVVEGRDREAVRIPLADIQSVLLHAGHATYSHGLLQRLSEHGIPLVVCNARHEPASVLMPLSGHHMFGGRSRDQADSPLPLRKRLWRDLVRRKIAEQADTLKPFDTVGANGLKRLVPKVRSGDPDNVEARAARYYWPRLFGGDFRRDRKQPGLNAHLNYGYTILRSALARAITAAGLIPSLGVGHVNARNNFCLADDLLEPFRPLVDRLVWRHRDTWNGELSDEARSALAGMMALPLIGEDGETDLFRVMTLLVNSLADLYAEERGKLILPKHIAFSTTPRLPGLMDKEMKPCCPNTVSCG